MNEVNCMSEEELRAHLKKMEKNKEELKFQEQSEYYGAAEPPVRCGESHLSGLTEPPHLFCY